MKKRGTRVAWWGLFSWVAVLLPTLAHGAPPPSDPSPFVIVGFIERFTLDDPNDVLSSAKVRVNGIDVTLPRNTLVTLPAAFLTPQELFTQAPSPWGPTQSGMALADSPAPIVPCEATLEGNRVGDQYIAGLVHISQQSLNTAQGFINFIDYVTGELRVGGVIGDRTTGARVRINDPNGRFGRAQSPDPRFTVDDENPTIHATTGFPMCIPRVDPADGTDPECPQTNRPKDATGRFVTSFTMNPPGVAVSGGTDPTKQAPFEVGDYITYAGTLMKDELGSFVSAHTIDVNLGIFTAPGTLPSYFSIEEVLLGVAPGRQPPGAVPQETTTRFTLVGFTTDPFTLVDFSAIVQNPCTGADQERLLGTSNPLAQGVLGRFRFVVGASSFNPPFRELIVRSRLGTRPGVANGLVGGQYRSPVGEFIFGEDTVFGSRPTPLNFESFPFLARGSGPYNGGERMDTLFPWPGIPTPQPILCDANGNGSPVADAGADFPVISNGLAVLDGLQSFDPDGGPIFMSWRQIGGPPVQLRNPNSATPTFTAPFVPQGSAAVKLTFLLSVSDFNSTSIDTVEVTVNPAGDSVAITQATFIVNRSILTVNATSSDGTGAASLEVVGVGFMTHLGNGQYTLTLRGATPISTVHVRSSLGGGASLPVTFR